MSVTQAQFLQPHLFIQAINPLFQVTVNNYSVGFRLGLGWGVIIFS